MGFLDALRRRAAARPRRVGFPEADEERTAEAIRRLASEELVRPVAVGRRAGVAELLEEVPGLEHFDTGSREAIEELGVLDGNSLRAAAGLVARGRLHGAVAGARAPTAEVVRAALEEIGLAPELETLSSSFYMSGMTRSPSEAEVLTFTDAGVVPDPTPAQLAEIAAAASRARERVVGDEPRVAFLSYSTRGSAEGASVRKVREALARFRERMPEVPADGELQADAALVREVAERKAAGSEVAGTANVLVFPDLDAGNIAYKLVERLAGASALGPILQGLAAPFHDLSRGAAVEDIVHVACIAALTAD